MKIRRATASDVPELTVVINRAYRAKQGESLWTTEGELIEGTRISQDTVRKFVEDTRRVHYVLEDTEKHCVAGSVGVELTGAPGEVEIGTLAVSLAYQGKGYGNDLLAFAENAAREEFGAENAIMHVLHVREDIMGWYTRKGYVKTDLPAQPWKEITQDSPECGTPKQDLFFITIKKSLKK